MPQWKVAVSSLTGRNGIWRDDQKEKQWILKMHFVLPGNLPELYGGYFNLQKIESVLLFLFMADEMALIFLRMAVSFFTGRSRVCFKR